MKYKQQKLNQKKKTYINLTETTEKYQLQNNTKLQSFHKAEN